MLWARRCFESVVVVRVAGVNVRNGKPALTEILLALFAEVGLEGYRVAVVRLEYGVDSISKKWDESDHKVNEGQNVHP